MFEDKKRGVKENKKDAPTPTDAPLHDNSDSKNNTSKSSKSQDGNGNGNGRTRNFATIVYPESAVKNWREILSEQFIPTLISPLHDKDLNPSGELKKAHHHVIFMFDSVKTLDQAKEICDLINGVGCEKVNSIRGYARYLCHLDNPEKVQYKQEDVTALCGADFSAVISLVTDKYKAIGEMISHCKENGVDAYSDLLEYAMLNRFDWFRVLCDNGTVVIKEYLKSSYWNKSRNQRNEFENKQEVGKATNAEKIPVKPTIEEK